MKKATITTSRRVLWGGGCILVAGAVCLMLYLRSEALAAPSAWLAENINLLRLYFLAMLGGLGVMLLGLVFEVGVFIQSRRHGDPRSVVPVIRGGAMVLLLPLLLAASPWWMGGFGPPSPETVTVPTAYSAAPVMQDDDDNPCSGSGDDCFDCIISFGLAITSCKNCLTGTWRCWRDGDFCERLCSKRWLKSRCVAKCRELQEQEKS